MQFRQIHLPGPGLAVAGLGSCLSVLLSRFIGQTLIVIPIAAACSAGGISYLLITLIARFMDVSL